jgi:Uncharacterized conserved small protein
MSTIVTIAARSATEDRSARKTFGVRVLTIVEALERMAARRRSRRALLNLTDEQLKDIGISRADAYREGIRNAWE